VNTVVVQWKGVDGTRVGVPQKLVLGAGAMSSIEDFEEGEGSSKSFEGLLSITAEPGGLRFFSGFGGAMRLPIRTSYKSATSS
jgi:hypothetical protein